jgi:SAM-dependent methyltransferase
MRTSYREKIYRKYVETYSEVYRMNDSLSEFSRRSLHYDLNYGAMLPPGRKSRILEIGSGPGYFLKYLRDKGYENAYGVDASPQQVKTASLMEVSNLAHCDFFAFLEGSDTLYDLICSFHVLEHLFKDEIMRLLELIGLRLNKGGMVLIEVPNAGSPLFGNQGRYGEFTHETGFSSTSLKEILMVCGFEDVKVFPSRAKSVFARALFGSLNFLMHSRFNNDIYFEGELFAVGRKGEGGDAQCET